MNKQDLEALVKECISEVVAEEQSTKKMQEGSYKKETDPNAGKYVIVSDKGNRITDEYFDSTSDASDYIRKKGIKLSAIHIKKLPAERSVYKSDNESIKEDTYGEGYAAGEKAAKSKYKKLAEAFLSLSKKTSPARYGDESEEETARMRAAVNKPSYGDESEDEVARMKANLEKLRRGEEIDESAESDKNKLKKYKEYTYTLDGKTVKPEITFLNNILKAMLNNKIYNIGSPKDGKVELTPESGKKGTYTESTELGEAEAKPKMTSDAQAIINIIEKQPMLIQKLALISDRRELEDVFDYLIKKLNPQLVKNSTGIRTAINNTIQKVANVDKELNEDNLQVKSIAKNIYSVLTKNGVNAKLIASIPSAGPSGKSIGATLTGGSNEALVYYWDDPKTKLTTVEIYLSGDKEDVLNFEKKILSSFPGLEQYSRAEYSTPQAFKLVFRVKEKTTAKGGIQELKKVLKK